MTDYNSSRTRMQSVLARAQWGMATLLGKGGALRKGFVAHMRSHGWNGWPRANVYFTCFLILYVVSSLAFFLSPLPLGRNSDIYLLSRNQELIFEYSDPNRGIQKAPGNVPETLKGLLLLAEDQDFYQHGGLDFTAIGRALVSNLMAGRIVSGASTIPQQYVRIAFSQRMPKSPYLRKPVEALYALKLGAKWSRDELLNRYLEEAPLGRNRKGFYSAARYYFGKDLSLLGCEEQTVLIILLRRTSMGLDSIRRRIQHLFERAKEERPEIARECGWDNQTQIAFPDTFRFYQDSALENVHRGDSEAPAMSEIPTGGPRATESSETRESNSQDHGGRENTEQERSAIPSQILSGYPHSAPHLGVYLFHNLNVRGEVFTEMDDGLQTHIQSIIQGELEVLEKKGANQAAVIVLERDTRHSNRSADTMEPRSEEPGWLLRAMIGSSDFSGADGQVNGALAIHDAGSVLKPFLYALAIEELGLRPGHLIDDSEYIVSDTIRKETYAPRNHDLRFSGIITVREALAGSRNIPAVRLIERMGPERFYTLLKDAGFEHMQEPARDYGPSLALGTGGATLFEVTLLYAALAARGQMHPIQIAHSPHLSFGESRQLFREDTALLIRHILSDRDARKGSFGPRSFLDFPFDVAAKTGTSKDFRDSWAVGYTDQFVVGVWVGNFQSEPTLGVSGARGAGRIMHQVMRMLYENQDSTFRYPDRWRYANICKKTGHLAGPQCPHFTEPFLPEDVFPPPCSGDHNQTLARGIVHPLDDQIFVLDPHRPTDSQAVLLEIRAEPECHYSLNGIRKSIPRDGHFRTHLRPEPGSYSVTLECPGRPPEKTLFRIQE